MKAVLKHMQAWTTIHRGNHMRRCAPLIAIVLFTIWFGSPHAQDINHARQLFEQALEVLKITPPQPESIATPGAFTAALEAAAPGAVLQLAPEFSYPDALTIRKPVTVQGVTGSDRMDLDTPMPKFTGGLTLAGDDVTVRGVEVRRSTVGDIVVLRGARVTLERSRVLGDPVKGVKRCVQTNGKGDVKVLRNYVADCFLPSPGQDSQAIGGWEMDPGLLIEDNYLEGGSETIMFGGADSSSDDKTPADIVIRGNTIGKKLAWFGQAIGVKNVLELKNAKRVLIEKNDFCCSWTQGQVGFGLTLTVRNQDGGAPWSTIQDVTIRNNTWRDIASAIAILGRDDIKETREGRDVPMGTVRRSVPMARVTISGDTFALDPVKYGKGNINSKAIQIGGGPIALTIENVTITSASRVGSALSFPAGPIVSGFRFINVTVPASRYGLFGDASTVAAANWTATNPTWMKYVQDGTIENVTVR